VNAQEWLAHGNGVPADVVVLGAPISKASISPSNAWSTPPAVRAALARFPTWDAEHDTDLGDLTVRDLGDVEGDRDDPDARDAHARIQAAVTEAARRGRCVAVIGGDNSLTRPAMHGLVAAHGGDWGLLTLDAHHDCRPLDGGPRNGTPVRELIEAGLPGERVAQVGIHPFGNAREQAEWAHARHVHVYPVAQVRKAGIDTTLATALSALVRSGASRIYVDVDVDVVDRAFAPACPASMPGGLLPAELLRAVHTLGRNPRVAGIDITEVDAEADVAGVTVRLAAAALLAFCSGVAGRPKSRPL